MSYEITSDPLALSVADGAATLDIAASRDGYFMAAVMVDGRETVGVRVPEAAMVTFARAVLAAQEPKATVIAVGWPPKLVEFPRTLLRTE